jgi:uncharacterized membrane protein
MPEISIAIKAAIAILVVFMSWRSGRKRQEKWLITTVAMLWVASAVVDIVQERRTATRQTEIGAAQKQMADALNVLKMNSEQDKRNKEAEAQRRQSIHSQLVLLMEDGDQSRKACQNPKSDAEHVWTKKVEHYLHGISPADETTFTVTDVGFACFGSMSVKLSTLQKIMDEYN